jgi:UDP-N-acetyl-D-mannosaminuronate dehydrogenase
VIGVDIDRNLIKSAINNMHKMINEAESSEFIKAHTDDLDTLMVANEREK